MISQEIARDLLIVAKEVLGVSTEDRKISRATVKSVLKKMGLKSDQYDLDSSDVTFWPERFADDWHRGMKMAKKYSDQFSKALGGLSIKSNGSKYWVRWKGEFLSMGEHGDPASRWHY